MRKENKNMTKRGNKIMAVLLSVVLLAGIAVWLVRSLLRSEVGVEVDEGIRVTPEQITSIKGIGEWEFLAVANEELVDTVRKGVFSDDHLVRIYYGTARLGVNMHQVEPGWISTEGDTLLVTLPAVGLLDRDFIDEGRTKSFFESGRWSHQDRDALYRKAYRQMLEHSLTKENINSARENGKEQFRRMMKAIGFDRVHVRFKE
jgi:hypothetical protein